MYEGGRTPTLLVSTGSTALGGPLSLRTAALLASVCAEPLAGAVSASRTAPSNVAVFLICHSCVVVLRVRPVGFCSPELMPELRPVGAPALSGEAGIFVG